MELALELAEMALTSGNPPVGAVLVYKNKIVGKGYELAKSSKNITNHAEILAVQDVINAGLENKLSLCTLYTTHEPCIMCSYIIRHYKIKRIVYGVAVSNVGGHTSTLKVLLDENNKKWGKSPEIIPFVLEEKCKFLNRKFEILNDKYRT